MKINYISNNCNIKKSCSKISHHLSGRFSTHIWLPLERSWREIADFFSTATYFTKSWTPTKAAAWKLWSKEDTQFDASVKPNSVTIKHTQNTTFQYQALPPTSSHRLWSPRSEADGRSRQQQQRLRDKNRLRAKKQSPISQYTLFTTCLPCPYISSASICPSGPVLSTWRQTARIKNISLTLLNELIIQNKINSCFF